MCSTKKPSEHFDRGCSSRWEAVAEAAAVEAAVALGAAAAAMAAAASMAAAVEAAMVAAASSLGGAAVAVVAEVAVWCRAAAATVRHHSFDGVDKYQASEAVVCTFQPPSRCRLLCRFIV
jgi:hypothetical protein